MDAHEINLLTICKGGIPEFFQNAVMKIWADIADPNTSVKSVRRLKLEFTFTPYPDRSGMMIGIEPIDPKLGKIDTSEFTCAAFLAKHDGKIRAYTRDLRQELLFDDKDLVPDGKTAAGGG